MFNFLACAKISGKILECRNVPLLGTVKVDSKSKILVSTLRRVIGFKSISVLWISPTTVDVFLHAQSLLDILRHFENLGNNVTLIAPRSRDASLFKISRVSMIFIPLRFVPFVSSIMFTVISFLFMPIFMIISKPDYVILVPEVSILSSISGLIISKFRKVKFVLDIRTTPVEAAGFRGFLHRFWFSVSVLIAKKLFTGITIITPLMKNEICSVFNVNPKKVGVWTSAVADSLFNPETSASEGEKLKEKFGLKGKFVVFYHGIFAATRGLTETIEAVKILKQKNLDVVFFLLGSGPLLAMLKVSIQKEGLQNNVIIHNPVKQLDVPKFIGFSDVGIVPLPNHPYWRFQSPLKLLEYLSMEKVVVVTDIPAHRLIADNAKCAIYISSINPTEIAKAIEYAYHNKNKLAEWGKIGRTLIKQKYTWPKVAADLENYLLSINDK